MAIMPLKAFLVIFVIFGTLMVINCSIDDQMFSYENVNIIEGEINNPILPKIEDQSSNCHGILFCYISQLSPLNNKGTWKPTKAFQLTKKGTSKLCQNLFNNVKDKYPNLENLPWHGLVVPKTVTITMEIQADIFDGPLHVIRIPLSELDSYLFGRDESTKEKIIDHYIKHEKELFNARPNWGSLITQLTLPPYVPKFFKPLLDENVGLLSLKRDIMAKQPKNIQSKPAKRVFLWAHVNVNGCPINEKTTEKTTFGQSIIKSTPTIIKKTKLSTTSLGTKSITTGRTVKSTATSKRMFTTTVLTTPTTKTTSTTTTTTKIPTTTTSAKPSGDEIGIDDHGLPKGYTCVNKCDPKSIKLSSKNGQKLLIDEGSKVKDDCQTIVLTCSTNQPIAAVTFGRHESGHFTKSVQAMEGADTKIRAKIYCVREESTKKVGWLRNVSNNNPKMFFFVKEAQCEQQKNWRKKEI